MQIDPTPMEGNLAISGKLHMHLPFYPAILLLENDPEKCISNNIKIHIIEGYSL